MALQRSATRRAPREPAGPGLLAEAAILVKTVDGFAQLACALLLVVVPDSVLTGATNGFATRDAITDPDRRFAEHVSSAADRVSYGAQVWLVVGLFAVALIKLAIGVLGLLRSDGAVPLGAGVFGVLLAFEVVRAGGHFTTTELLLFGMDALVVVVLACSLYTRRRGVLPRLTGTGTARISPR